MLNKKRLLIGVAGVLLLAAGVGAGIAATDGSPGRRWGHHGDGLHGHDRGEHHGHGGWGGRRAARTPEEVDTRLRERFARLDRNSDGTIDRGEIEAMMTEHRGHEGQGPEDQGHGRRYGRHGGANDEQAQRHPAGGAPGERMLRRFDENKDGKVTKDEFLGTIKRRFAQMDLDGDGKITDADLPPMLRGRGVLTATGPTLGAGEDQMQGPGRGHGGRRGMWLGWLRAADANGDGLITLEEVTAQAEKEFARLDRNGDGIADQADRAIVRKEMIDYGVQRFLHGFDAGKEGKITREQFTKVSKERLARMDVDGSQDRERGERMRRGWRGNHGGPDRGGPPGETATEGKR